MNKLCFVSIDVEADCKARDDFKGVENLDSILDIFRKYSVSATLFTTGYVLEKYPERVKSWSKDFEIACHTFTHRYWNTISQEQRRVELEKFNNLYLQIFNKKPAGFRAPSHIIDEDGLKLLEQNGFLYDSSIVPHYPPFKKYRGYQGRAPLLPYYPSGKHCRRKGKMSLLEIPASGLLFGIPLAGAWFSRLPLSLYNLLFNLCPPSFITLSMHPWDVSKPDFLEKLEQILELLKNKNYQFVNGKQIHASFSKNR